MRFCVGHPLSIDIAQKILEVPEGCWQPALSADGAELRESALDGDLAKAEPKRLRHCLLHTTGRLVRTGRQTLCRLPNDWPWTPHLLTAHERIHNLPLII